MRASVSGLLGLLVLAGGAGAEDAGWYPSRYGADDTLGAMNELSAEGVLAAAGVRAVVQPGGSVNDEKVIAAAERAGVTMYLTGTRHFFH